MAEEYNGMFHQPTDEEWEIERKRLEKLYYKCENKNKYGKEKRRV